MRKEKGSIAIFVLVALLFMSAFLIISFARNVNKSKIVKEQMEVINDIYQYSEHGLEDKRIANTKVNKGDFVEYNVAYTDVYKNNYQYTNTNGWRLLDYTDNGDGTYSNVKLISTGVPAKLVYYDGSENKDWWITGDLQLTKFREILTDNGTEEYTFYMDTNNDYIALEIAAGLYYNFGDIKFQYTSTVGSSNNNKGFFTSITSNGTTYDSNNTAEITGTNLFNLYQDKATIRLVTLPEVNKALGRTDIDSTTSISDTEDSIGLYNLKQLQNIDGMSEYVYSDSTFFWLASPDSSSNDCICAILGNNIAPGGPTAPWGVRPVICLNSKVKLIDGDNNGALEIYFK